MDMTCGDRHLKFRSLDLQIYDWQNAATNSPTGPNVGPRPDIGNDIGAHECPTVPSIPCVPTWSPVLGHFATNVLELYAVFARTCGVTSLSTTLRYFLWTFVGLNDRLVQVTLTSSTSTSTTAVAAEVTEVTTTQQTVPVPVTSTESKQVQVEVKEETSTPMTTVSTSTSSAPHTSPQRPLVSAQPFSASESLVWDWQALTMIIAITACALFMVVLAGYAVVQARSATGRRRQLERDNWYWLNKFTYGHTSDLEEATAHLSLFTSSEQPALLAEGLIPIAAAVVASSQHRQSSDTETAGLYSTNQCLYLEKLLE
ncbi:hypothetical protein B566_EDAN007121 [Ephemera danica]|nr:hypothetical protein B566_EDAN007121 [Ephemera danica]